MTAEELIAKAAACKRCGREHQYLRVGERQASWASPEDGHSYEPAVDEDAVAVLRYLVTGTYVSAWTPKDPTPRGRRRKAVSS